MAQAGLDFPASPEISRVGGQRMSSTHTHFVSPQSSGPSALSRTVTDRFDVERRGHAMMIDNVPRGVSYIVLANLFDVSNFFSKALRSRANIGQA